MEPSRLADEQQDFDNIVETRSPERSYNGNYSSRLSAAENKPLGPFTMLPVQRGDSLTMSAFASYQVGAPAGKPWALAAFVSSLFNSTAPPPPGTEGYRHGKYTPYIGLALGASITAFQTEEGVPVAYLKYIVLDHDSNYVYSDVQVISSAAGQNWQELKLQYKVEQEGFVQVFVYNESGQEVFFDDITIRKDPGLIVQENHYDPWGMNLVGIEKQGNPDHKWQFQGQEKQEALGLNWVQFKWRNHQPDIGRFFNIDPLAEKFTHNSPYAFSENKVTSHVELEGAEALDFRLHMALNNGNIGAGSVSYVADWLHDKIIGGGVRMAQGAHDYVVNENNHDQYRNGSFHEQVIPENVEQVNYSLNKIAATGKMIQGLTDQAEGYMTLQSVFMGGLEGTMAKQAGSSSVKTFNRMIENILTDTKASADDIAAQFTESGYKANVTGLRTGRGQMITIEGHSQINTIKIHGGGGGRHGVARVQIIGQNNSLDVKVINGSRSNYKGNIAEEEEAGRLFIFTQ